MTQAIVAAITALVGVVGFTTTTRAAGGLTSQPAFVGTWASHRSACSILQEKRGAPMIVTAQGYDQHESHCQFKTVSKGLTGTWTIAATCRVEGDAQKHTFKVTASRDRLTIREGDKARTLVRC